MLKVVPRALGVASSGHDPPGKGYTPTTLWHPLIPDLGLQLYPKYKSQVHPSGFHCCVIPTIISEVPSNSETPMFVSTNGPLAVPQPTVLLLPGKEGSPVLYNVSTQQTETDISGPHHP